MTPEFKAMANAACALSRSIVNTEPDETIQELYNELVAAHQTWWETTETWKTVNAEHDDPLKEPEA